VEMYVPSLTQAGYTVFAVTHRATPAFRYPAPLEDAQRVVRFIRHHAAKYGIDAARMCTRWMLKTEGSNRVPVRYCLQAFSFSG
jgi:hypothetical protein